MSFEAHWRLFHDDFCDTVSGFPLEPSLAKPALKTALSCVIAVMLTDFLRIPHAYWAGISVLIMMQPNVSAELMKGWQRAGGACIGSFFGIFYAGLVVQSPLLFSILTILLVTTGIYLGNTQKFGYFWSYMTFHLHIICILSIMGPSGTADITTGSLIPEHIAFYRGAAVSIGVIVAIVVNLLIKPDFSFAIARDKAGKLKTGLKEFLDAVVTGYLNGKNNDEDFEKKYSELVRGIDSYIALFNQSKVERKFFFDEELSLDPQRAVDLRRCVKDIRSLYRNFEQTGSSLTGEFGEQLKKLPEFFLDALTNKSRSSEQKLRNALNEFEDILKQENPKIPKYGTHELILFLGFIGGLRKLFGVIFCGEISGIKKSEANLAGTENAVSSLKNIRINVPVLKIALRGAFSILFVFWFWLWMEIPGGGANMAISIIAVFQVNLLNTHHKGILRFAGCLTGAATGLFVLALGIQSTLFICIILFCVVYCFAYVWGGKPGSAYFGLQGALAFVICVMSSTGPAATLSSGLERLTGILIAISCLWLINNVIFPIDMTKSFLKSLNGLRDKLIEKLDRAMEILTSGHDRAALARISAESSLSLLTQLRRYNEINAKEYYSSIELITLYDDISICIGKAISLLTDENRSLIVSDGVYEAGFKLFNEILSKDPETSSSCEKTINKLEKRLNETLKHPFELIKPEANVKNIYFIIESVMNKKNLISELRRLCAIDYSGGPAI